jgi:hypothetical protein
MWKAPKGCLEATIKELSMWEKAQRDEESTSDHDHDCEREHLSLFVVGFDHESRTNPQSSADRRTGIIEDLVAWLTEQRQSVSFIFLIWPPFCTHPPPPPYLLVSLAHQLSEPLLPLTPHFINQTQRTPPSAKILKPVTRLSQQHSAKRDRHWLLFEPRRSACRHHM